MIKTLYKKFQPWSKGGSVYLIGDLHLGDERCRQIYKNWPSVKTQIDVLKKVCNGKKNTLIVLGDVGNKATALSALNCRKILIKGNHDAGSAKYKSIFNEVYEGPLFIAEKILLSHEPVRLSCALNIHGHSHCQNDTDLANPLHKHVNVCANKIGFTPVNLKNIIHTGVLNRIPSIHECSCTEYKQ